MSSNIVYADNRCSGNMTACMHHSSQHDHDRTLLLLQSGDKNNSNSTSNSR